MRKKVSKCRDSEVRKKVKRRTRGWGIGNTGKGGARAPAQSLSAGHNTL